jgi:hypothetical protein
MVEVARAISIIGLFGLRCGAVPWDMRIRLPELRVLLLQATS